MSANQAHAVLDEGHGAVWSPFAVESSVELLRGGNPLRENEVDLLSHGFPVHNFPYLFHTGVVATGNTTCEFPGVGQTLPNDNELVDSEFLPLVNVEEDGPGLQVCQTAFLGPSPTNTVVPVASTSNAKKIPGTLDSTVPAIPNQRRVLVEGTTHESSEWLPGDD